jgi:putative glutamine amidotransferase
VIGILCSDDCVLRRNIYLKELGPSLVQSGGTPRLIFPLRGSVPDMMDGLHALLVPGGDDIDPELYGGDPTLPHWTIDRPFDDFEIECVRLAYQRRMPLLGICRGEELINVAGGGTLVEDIKTVHPDSLKHFYTLVVKRREQRRHAVHGLKVDPDSRLASWIGTDPVTVNSMHHMCIDQVSSLLRATAWADDGTIEAVERPDSPWQGGVQFHPEWLRLENPLFQKIFDGFVEDGEKYRQGTLL